MAKGFPVAHGGSNLKQEIDSHAENHTGVTIYDKTDPRSVYNLVSDEMQKAIENVHPEYFKWSFKAIEKHAKPSERDYQLRVAFWKEYNYTQDNWKRSLSLTNVTRGVCTKDYLYEEVMRDPLKLCFMLYPVTDMVSAMEEMMDLSLREMRRILRLPNQGKKGANIPIIKEKVKIWALLQNRLKGAVIQRVEKRSVHAHVHTKTQEAPKSVDELEREMRMIEKEIKQQSHSNPLPSMVEKTPETIDVTPGDEEKGMAEPSNEDT